MDEARVRDLVSQLATEVGLGGGTPPATGTGTGTGTGTPSGPTTIAVKAGQGIQAACDAAPSGSTILIDPGVYPESLHLGTKALTLQPAVIVRSGQANRATTPVTIMGTTTIVPGQRTILLGLTHKSPHADDTLITDQGTRTVLDRCLILGDPHNGQHRGVAANGTDGLYTDCFIDDCGLVGQDAQAVLGWDGTKRLTLLRCYLGGGAQSVMFGGADSASADRIPTDITIKSCVLGKNPAWYDLGWQIKNGFELKAAVNVTVQDTEILYAGVSGGQAAYLIVLTPRNQGGQAPWSTIQNVLFERVRCQFGGGGVLALGSDDTVGKPSGPLEGVTFRNVAFLDLDPRSPVWTQPTAAVPHLGSGRVFNLSRAPKRITIDGVTATGINLASPMYVIPPGPTGLVVKNYQTPTTKYGWKIDGGGASGIDGLKALCPDAQITPLQPTDQGAQGYPRQGQ